MTWLAPLTRATLELSGRPGPHTACACRSSFGFGSRLRGGPIGLIENGDTITIDAEARRIDVDCDFDARRAAHTPKAPNKMGGVFDKYARLVSSAAIGAVTIETDAPSPSPKNS